MRSARSSQRRLDADRLHARQEANHRLWSSLSRLAETLGPSGLDLPHLFQYEPPALHVTVQFGQRIRWDRLTFARAQVMEQVSCFLELRIGVTIPSLAKAAFMRFAALEA